MQDTHLNEEYTVVSKGIEVRCRGIEQVVAAVNALSDREVAVPLATFAETERAERSNVPAPLAQAIHDVIVDAPRALRPIEVMRAIKRRGVRGASYNNVYATLRYGPFEKREGRWSVSAA